MRLQDLRRFLECPLQGGARLALGLRTLSDDTDLRSTTDEPFELSRSVEHTLLGELFTATWRQPEPPSLEALVSAHGRAIRAQRFARALPTGLFGDAVIERHRETMRWWRAGIACASPPMAGPLVEISIGRPDDDTSAAPDDQREALRFRVVVRGGEQELEIELRARPAPQVRLGDEPGSLLLSASPYPKEDLDGLRIFFDHVVLAAAAPADAPPRRHRGVVVRPPSEKSARPSVTTISFGPLAAERARTYLADLLGDVFAGAHDYLLPCEAIFLHRKGGRERDLRDWVAEVRDDPTRRRLSTTGRGPVPDPFGYRIPSETDALAMAHRRFDLFFELREDLRRAAREPG